MLLSGRREARECPHKICLNSHSSSLLRQMQPLWGRICSGEFKKWNWTKCVRFAIWSLREWKGRRDARRRATLAGRVKHKFWAIKKDHFFFFFFSADDAIQAHFILFVFTHPPNNEVGCIPDSRCLCRNQSWIPCRAAAWAAHHDCACHQSQHVHQMRQNECSLCWHSPF